MERIIASTTEDPFVSILATATAPSTEEPVTPAADRSVTDFILFYFWGESFDIDWHRSSIRSGSPRRLPTTNRRFGNTNVRATTTTTTTTTAAPTTEATTVATGRRISANRFGASRTPRPSTTVATTTAQPVIEEPKPTVDTSARARLFPKR